MQLDSLLTDIVLYVPGCPEPTILRALAASARAFCQESQVIQIESDAVLTTAGIPDFDITDFGDANTDVIAVRSIRVDGKSISSKGQDWMRSMRQYLDQTPAAKPTTYYMTSETTGKLFPTPDASTYTLNFTLAVEPTLQATVIPDELGRRWNEGVIGGALMRLCLMPGERWTSADMAALGKGMYYTQLTKAKAAAMFSNSRQSRLVMNPIA